MKNKTWMATGQILLALSLIGFVLNPYILNNNPINNFIIGVFMGVSLVFNVSHLLRLNKKKRCPTSSNSGKGFSVI